MTNGEYQKLREKAGGELTYTMDLISHERRFCEQDLYVISGQPKSLTTDPIDSWTLFRWMQNHDIPSRYLVHEKSTFYKTLQERGELKDVVVLGDELFREGGLLEHQELWRRAKAFIVEWGIDILVDEWMRREPRLRYVNLRHGVAGTWYTDILRYQYHNVFNDVNASSEDERRLIAEGDPDLYRRIFLAGLPRYDLLAEVSSASVSAEHTVFVMMTWRMGLRSDAAKLSQSLYWRRLQAFLSHEFIEQLHQRHVRVIFAPHHAMVEQIADWCSMEGVELSSQDQISYWIRHADAFVTDFSSVSYDFHFQYKPVIYWIPDSDMVPMDEDDQQDRQKIDSALSRQSFFFNVAHSADEVLSLLSDYADRGFVLEPEKCRIVDSFFANRSDFCRRAYECIRERYEAECRERSSQETVAPVPSPKISVIIPVYNEGPYLRECLDSIAGQTLREIEYIAVNDGSSDNSLDILEEYARKDGRLRVIHQRNQGTFMARRVGFRASRGCYVLFVDPDDWIEPDTCEKALSTIEKTGDDILFFGVTCENEGNINEEEFRSVCESSAALPAASLTGRENMLRACYIDRTFSWVVWGRLFSRSLLERAFAEMPHLRCVYAEDMLSTFYFLSFSRSVSSVNNTFYHYRVGVGISTKESIADEHFFAVLRSYELFFHVRRFAQSHFVDSVIVCDVLNRIERMLDDGVLAMSYRTSEAIRLQKQVRQPEDQHLIVQQMGEQIRILQSKRARYLKLLRLLTVISVLLLFAIISLLFLS